MKRILIILSGAVLLAAPSVLGQQPLPAPGVRLANPAPQDLYYNLTKFDLDFPGGTPRRLVEAIEKASGRPLNAIIPDEFANLKLPALRMKNVNVAQLFDGLAAASSKAVTYETVINEYGQLGIAGRRGQGAYTENYGFRTQGAVNDDSVWYFYYNQKPNFEDRKQKACRFYQLTPYLETYKIEDITTAIQTGWKMLGETNPPTISYHKDTKLLIAVGDSDKLQLIDQVLMQLPKKEPTSTERREAEMRELREANKRNFAPAEK